MPYITTEKREALDASIESTLDAMRQLESDDPQNSTAGCLNYIFTRLLVGTYSAPRYDDINEMVGVLECCKLEIYRRLAAPYEDQKRFDNGDVY
jgi:hypothetical protein